MTITENIHRSTQIFNRVFSTLLLCLIIYILAFSWQSLLVEKAEKVNDIRNVIELGEKAFDAYFTHIQNCMHELGQSIIGVDEQIDVDPAFLLLKGFKQRHPELINITFIREDGQILFTAAAPPSPTQPTLALEPSFIKYRNELQQGQPLSIGQPIECLIAKEWAVPFRYAINNKEGKPAYIISACLPVDTLQIYWKNAPFTKSASLGLMRDDGFLISRYPAPKREMENLYGIPATGSLIDFMRQENFPANGSVEGYSSHDGLDQLNVFCRLEHFPLTLFVKLPVSELRMAWWSKVKVPYILTAFMLMGGIFFYRLIILQERTRQKELYRASEVLRQSEVRFRKLFEQNSAVMLMIDPNTGNIIDANKAASDYYGWTIEKLKQKQIQEINILSPEAVKSEIEKTISSGSMRHEFRHRTSDSSICDVEVFSTKIENSGKTFLYSIIHDITNRKLSEQAQRESESRLQTLVQTIPELIWLKNTDGIYLDCNPMFERMCGAAKKDILGKTDYDFVDRELADFFRENDCKAIAAGKPCSNEEWLIFAADGYRGVFDTIRTPMSNADGKLVGILGIARDISERKRIEEELRKSEERLALALKATHDAVWDWDLLVGTIYCSHLWWNMIGYKENEMEADSALLRIVMHPEDLWQFGHIVNEIKTGESSFEIESRLRHKNGHYVIVLMRGWVQRDKSGRAVRVSGINTDLTDRKRIEAERRQWEHQCYQIQKIESLNRMAGGIAHHFNNQLQVVMGNLEMAIDALPQGADSVDQLSSAMQASCKAAEISGMMLTYLGQTAGHPESIDLSKVCRQCLTLVQAADPKCMKLKADLPPSGPIICSIPRQIQQVMTNLLTNALEATDYKYGGIALTVKAVSCGDIPVSKRFPIDWQPQEIVYACLEVTDTGAGIRDSDIEKLFDPFFTTKFTGRGMGLSVVLGIVRAHKGGVTVESIPNQGSVFRVFIPAMVEEIRRPIGKLVPIPKIEWSGAVLLVDDDELLREIAMSMLTHLGFSVFEAKDGIDALEVFRQHQHEICCVLSDLMMPRMDGWDTLSALRKLSAEIPVILSSGYDEAQVMAGEHTERPNAFLGKPYQLKGLRETIYRVLADQQ